MIVDAAFELVEEVGSSAYSLSRVADRLGVTTNALYRYLGSRAELDMLLGERGLGPPPSTPDGVDWKEGVRFWVGALRNQHREHPWLVDVQAYVPLLPNVLGWLNDLLTTLTAGGMSTSAALRVASVVDGYVRSTAIRDREQIIDRDASQRALWFSPETVIEVTTLAQQRGMEQAVIVLQHGLFMTTALNDDESFDYGLELLLNGIEEELLHTTEGRSTA